jgi:glycosyltransferase involved in cell wall biosynthesis
MILNKMKHEYILITSQNFPVGGAGASYLNLFCRGLKLNGYSVSVLLLKGFGFGAYKNSDSRQNITDYSVPYEYLSSIHRPQYEILRVADDLIVFFRLWLFLIQKIKRSNEISLLVYNGELQSNIPIYFISRLFKIKLITFVPEFYEKSDWTNTFFRKLKYWGFIISFKFLYKRSDKLIVFSHALKEKFCKMGYNEENIVIQPNLTDFDFWVTDDQEIKYTIGYSGTPSNKDGLNDLFTAIRMLNNKNIPVSLLVIGDSTFGNSLIPKLKIDCQNLGILEMITFTGLVDSSKVKEYLSECEILAITRPCTEQTKAGFPTKLGEYFAIGKPVLLTKFGDIEKYFEANTDVILAECGNPESIAQKIEWMINNMGALKTVSESGYKKANNLLEYKKSIIRIIDLIS